MTLRFIALTLRFILELDSEAAASTRLEATESEMCQVAYENFIFRHPPRMSR
jgi:hypothetical protein